MTFTKRRRDAPEGFFQAEAAGLAWLRVPGGPRIVDVLAVGEDSDGAWISLEQLHPVLPTADAAASFGAALAALHRTEAGTFGEAPEGWDGELFIGRRTMPSITSASWGKFYARGRVAPFVGPALAAGNLSSAQADVVFSACALIDAGTFDDGSTPRRIHGDLWAGNVLEDSSGVVLIDPAAHAGHPETDLAMLQLFGLPHLERVLHAYANHGALEPGWPDRVPVHQLHPLAVHAAGHGPSYGAALEDAARRTLALAKA